MITFEQLYHLNLSNLASAADQFRALVKNFEGMAESFKGDVMNHFNQAGWDFSLGDTSMVAYSQLEYSNREFDDAAKEARGVQGILEDAYQEFRRCRDNLKGLVDDANAKGLKVSPNGHVSAVEDLDTEANRTDSNMHGLIAKQKSQIDNYQIKINRAVRDAETADEFATMALQKVAGGNSTEGFNGKARASVDSYEADRASKLMQKFDKNEKLSQNEINELDQIMRLNKNDPGFSRMILDKLGPEKTLSIADDLADARGNDEYSRPERKHYAAIEKALASNIGTASKSKDFFADWHKDMRTQCDGHPRGYQTLATLLKHGDGSYPEHLTTSLTDDMIAVEKERPGAWDVHTRVGPGEQPDSQNIDDPVDDMLEVMSRNPEASTDFLDPQNGDRLKYLLDERDWPNIEARQQTPSGEWVGTSEAEATDSRAGLAHAIEAGARGDRTDATIDRGEHTAAEARILRDTVNRLDTGAQREYVPENMREPLARTLADYTEDTHKLLSGVYHDYENESKPGQDGVFSDGDGAHAAPHSDALIRVMRGISDDPDAYDVMHEAETAYITESMAGLPRDATVHDLRVPVQDGSAVLGVYDAIRNDVAYDLRDDKNSATDWNAKVAYHIIGAPVTPIPVVGDVAQRSIDAWTADMANQIKDDNNAATAADVAEKSLKSQNQMGFLVDRWAEERGIGADNPDVNGLQHDLRSGQNTERDNASILLGR